MANLPRGSHFTNLVLRELALISIVVELIIVSRYVTFGLNQKRFRSIGNRVTQNRLLLALSRTAC